MAEIIRQIADHYYVLEIDGREEIGCASKARLVHYARAQGIKQVQYIDARKPRARVKAWNPMRGEM